MLLLLSDVAAVFGVLLLLFMAVTEQGKQIASVSKRSEKRKTMHNLCCWHITSATDPMDVNTFGH